MGVRRLWILVGSKGEERVQEITVPARSAERDKKSFYFH
jgi:hypothetical protein